MQHAFALRSRLRAMPGLRTFFVVWLGQLVSLFGSALTSFALGLWAYQRTGSVTAYSMLALAATLPAVLFSPLAGLAADRVDRRKMMILSDLGAGLSTIGVVIILWNGQLEIWHLVVANLLSAVCGAFQWPAYAAATAQLVPKEQLGRVNGLVGIVQAATSVLAPSAAGFLVLRIGVSGVMMIDAATFLVAVSALLAVRFPALPQAEPAATGGAPGGKARAFFDNLASGWRYLTGQPGLFGLLMFLALFSYFWAMVSALAAPLVLNIGSAETLGVFITVAGSGMLAGSLVMGVWGGPKRRVWGIILFEMFSGVCFVLMGLKPDMVRIALAAFGAHFTIAIIDGSNKSIWQSKVPHELQGRVFGLWQMASKAAAPLAYLSAGPLADRLLEPLMSASGPVAAGTALPGLAQWVGVGPGRGIGLIFVLMGLLKALSALACSLNKNVRTVEDAAA